MLTEAPQKINDLFSPVFSILIIWFSVFLFSCSNHKVNSHENVFPQSIKDKFYGTNLTDSIIKADELRWAKKYLSAISFYENIINKPLDTLDQIYVLNQLLYCYHKTNFKEKVELRLTQLEQLEGFFPDLAYADYAFNKAQFLISKLQGEGAIRYLNQANETYKKYYQSTYLKQLEVLTLLGDVIYNFSDDLDGLEIVFDNLEKLEEPIASDINLIPYLKEYFYWKGFMSFMQRQPEEGIISADLAIQIASENEEYIDTAFIIQCLSVKGRLLKSVEKKNEHSLKSKASNILHEALEMSEHFKKDTFAIQYAYRDLLTYLTRVPDSVYYFYHLKKLRQLKPKLSIAQPTRLEALWHYRRKNYNEAIPLYQRLIQQLDNDEVLYNKTTLYDECYWLLSSMFLRKSRLESTIFYAMKNLTRGTSLYQKSKFSWKELNDPSILNDRVFSFIEYGHLATTYFKSYQEDSTQLEYLERAYQLFQITDTLIFNYTMMADKDVSLNFFSQIVASSYPHAIDASYERFRLTGEKKYLAQMNFFIERMKSFLMYQDMILKTDNRAEIPKQYLEKENTLKAELKKWKWLLLKAPNEEQRRQARLNIQLNLNEHRAFYRLIKKEYPLYFSTKMQINFSPLEELETYLDRHDKFVIQYAVVNDHIYVLLSQKGKASIKQLRKPRELDSLINEYKVKLSNPQNAFDQKAFHELTDVSHQLFQILVEPIYYEIPTNSSVTIIPDVKLGQIPFEPLLKDSISKVDKVDFQNLPYLLNDWSISYSTSLKTWLLNQNHKQDIRADPKVLAFSYSDSKSSQSALSNFFRSERMSELAGAVQEVKALQKIYGTKDHKYFFGKNSTKENFLKWGQEDFDIIHFALHAKSDAENYLNNQLFFRQKNNDLPQALYGYEIDQINIQAPLVVLSACATSKGITYEAEGTFSMMRSFMESGAKMVLSSFWNIDDSTTSEIMTSFYEYLAKKSSVQNALQNAKLEYIKNADQYLAFPGYWSAMVCWE